MVNRVLVYTSFFCCALVIASFAMFARDQIAGASQHQQSELAAGPPSSAGTSAPVGPHHRRQPRRFIDAAANTLTAPFRSIINSRSAWALHGFPALCALLAYGLGLGFLARFSRGLS